MRLFTPLLFVFLVFAGFAGAQTMPASLAALAARVMPAVVSVASTDPQNTPADSGTDDGDDVDASFSGVVPPPKAVEALGSGFVIDPAGYIVTNNHVISGAASIEVTFQDGTILPATIVGRDTDADLALLKVDAGHQLPFVHFGDSTKLRVGDWVMAIGNPFGLPGSASAGIVSALHRNINENTYDDFIQTDATINRGNSGGPLFDMNGNVIGVDTAIESPSGASDGIGFAIPSEMVAPVMQALRTTGAMTRGWLGASTEHVTPEIEKLLQLPNATGALVGAVAEGSPAAGKLRPGDVVVALAGVRIRDTRALFIRTAEIPAGHSAVVRFWRDGTEQQAVLRISAPPAALNDRVRRVGPGAAKNVDVAALGLSVAARPVDGALRVVTATGAAAKAGIVVGDRVEQVDGNDVASTAALQAQVKRLMQAYLPVAVLLVSGDAADGTDPGPRWVAVRMTP